MAAMIDYQIFFLSVLYEYSLIFGGLPRADWEWDALEDEAEYRFNLYQNLIIGD